MLLNIFEWLYSEFLVLPVGKTNKNDAGISYFGSMFNVYIL